MSRQYFVGCLAISIVVLLVMMLPWILCPPVAGGPMIDVPKVHAVRGQPAVVRLTIASDCTWPHRPVAEEVIPRSVEYRAVSSDGMVIKGKMPLILQQNGRWNAVFVSQLGKVPNNCIDLQFDVSFTWSGSKRLSVTTIIAELE